MTEASTSAVRSHWRLTYAPGDWLALAGPNAAVILQPASPQWSELIATIWEDVLVADSIDDLLSRMASFRLEGMPNFAAFFWAEDGLRSLVRGGITLVDDLTEAPIADGTGMHTWSETALSGIERVRLVLAPSADVSLQLPLIVGVAGVSSVVVDTGPERQVEIGSAISARTARDGMDLPPTAPVEKTSDASLGTEVGTSLGTGVGTGVGTGADTGGSEAVDEGAATGLLDPSELGFPDDDSLETEPAEADGNSAEVDGGRIDATEVEGDSDADDESTSFDEAEDGRTLLASNLPGAPQLPAPAPPSRMVVGVLVPSSGGRVDVDRQILVGRSPSASRISGDQLPRLLTVPSPSHDISRTHLQVAPGDGQVLVTDMNSTNGTILITPNGEQSLLEPSTPVPVEIGSVIDLGDGITIRLDAPGSPASA